MVQVVQTQNSVLNETKSVLSQVPWGTVAIITIITIIIALISIIIIWIFIKIYKKINEERKSKEDKEYYKYKLDLKMCRLNADSKFRYKSAITCWLFWKRAPVYANTEYGKKFIGYYDGEAVKKEDWFCFGLLQKHSLFNRETDVVILPYSLRKYIFKKNDDFSITIEAEGVDEVMSSEYYSIPIIKDSSTESNKVFIDFSNFVMDNFFKTYIYRDVLKQNIKDFNTNIKDATEMNAGIQIDRKTGSSLKE